MKVSQQNKGWEKNVIVMCACKDNLIPLLYSGEKKKVKKKKNMKGKGETFDHIEIKNF